MIKHNRWGEGEGHIREPERGRGGGAGREYKIYSLPSASSSETDLSLFALGGENGS